jgi:hypothetical protein
MNHACGRCGANYDEEAWGRLQLVKSVGPEEVRRLVRGWPDGTGVEVRRCRRCRKSLATRVIGAAPAER